MRSEHTHDGVLVVTYTGTLSEEQQARIAEIKEECSALILSRAPEHKQRNIGMGLVDQAEADAITSWITDCRDAYAAAKVQILAAATRDAVYAVRAKWPA